MAPEPLTECDGIKVKQGHQKTVQQLFLFLTKKPRISGRNIDRILFARTCVFIFLSFLLQGTASQYPYLLSLHCLKQLCKPNAMVTKVLHQASSSCFVS